MRDPILEGTLHRVRAESARVHRRRDRAAAVLSATLLSGVLLCGLHLGHRSTPQPLHLSATSGDIHLSATITPADGWVRLKATVTGLPPNHPYHLVITNAKGQTFKAAAWITTTAPETTLSGAALVPLPELTTLTLTTPTGHPLTTATR
ncbi:hypothetical protein [Saccharothrix sp.]|uniref:hypothetical protein n=1 Tax=Saccharothrix sp. TaxID=1873460 RepID=UPI0028122CEF|nr:hypothetical protein [Saccharothrix sp.]